ncbi:MAG: hypothetical protein E7373_05945 [Clostridiales bacterium]|nr:hypothetical protein [Clostridiales bacterium]
MAEQYPNQYYAELAEMIIKSPSLTTKSGEVCFYEGKAKSYQVVSKIVEKPKTKTSFFWTPWFAGIKRKKEVEVRQEQETEYYKGTLYITNMRIVFKCKVDAFDLPINAITTIKQYRDGIRVVSGTRAFDVMTKEVAQVLHIIEIMNKAFDAQENQASAQTTSAPKSTAPSASATSSRSRNDDYVIAAFIHYCEYGGKPIGKTSNDYPSYFNYDFHVNNPAKYHQKVVDEGYLEPAPLSVSLGNLKVDQLKQILIANGLPEKGKKDALIQRIVEGVNLSTLKLEVVYVPTDKGWEHLKKYEYLFIVKKYNITPAEYEAKQAELNSNRTNDIIWRILNDKFNEYNMEGYVGGARNVLLSQAELLASEDKNTDALYHYIAVLYYDMKSYENGSIEDVWLAPAIVKAIYDKKEFYSAEMVDRCFDRYPLPQYKMSKAKFAKLLNLIFEDETIDLSTL